MDLKELYARHLEKLIDVTAGALDQSRKMGQDCPGIVFHAGSQQYFHRDDQEVPFRGTFHLGRWAPLKGPSHLLVFTPGTQPRLITVTPKDYWYEPPVQVDHPYAEYLDISDVSDIQEAIGLLKDVKGYAYVGSDGHLPQELDLVVEPAPLMALLDFDRAFKTPYELECIRQAAAISSGGYAAVRRGMAEGMTERELHSLYLLATDQLENDTPYGNILGWDHHSAILHYASKSVEAPPRGHTFLIDAGASFCGYASDVTRSYTREGVHPVFAEALKRMDRLEQDLVERIRPGLSYIELHEIAMKGIASILSDLGIIRLPAGEIFEKDLCGPFFPHGLGHHLGLQVHDVGGRQIDAQGTIQDPPTRYPFLRTTRDLAEGHVVTIEPGLYFIPMLLEPLRSGKSAKHLDWKLIDELIPCGGIRVEDDVAVTAEGHENLTRDLIPG